jgi:hypothetical protein
MTKSEKMKRSVRNANYIPAFRLERREVLETRDDKIRRQGNAGSTTIFVIPSGVEESLNVICLAAIPLTIRDVSTSLDMTGIHE